jgi:hypothetical protein
MRRRYRSLVTRTAATVGVAAVVLTLPACGDQVRQPAAAGPGPVTVVPAQVMLTAAEVTKVYRAGTWRLEEDGPGDGSEGHHHDFTCQQAILGSMKPRRSWHRDFASSRGDTFSASQWVAAFGSPAKATAAFATVNRWLQTCGPDENRPDISISGLRRVAAVTASGGLGRAWLYSWEELEGGTTGIEFVGVGLRGNAVTVTTFRAPLPVAAHGPAPSESMIRAALQRLAG